MPRRDIILAKNQIYHVFNRGIARMQIFSTTTDFKRFLELVEYYRYANTPLSFSHFKKLPMDKQEEIITSLQQEDKLHVEILTFCLMDNHYHFLIKQISTHGIKIFISNIQNAYAKYFNVKRDRIGPLFQPMYKSVLIETDEQLLHVSRYIHLNPATGYKVKIENLERYSWSSLTHYISENVRQASFVSTKNILSFFKDKNTYREFVNDQADYQRELSKIQHLTF